MMTEGFHLSHCVLESGALLKGHALLAKARAVFPGAFIWCGGFTNREDAQAALDSRFVDLIALGRPYIANPDLVKRLKHGWPLAEADRSTCYAKRGEVVYTDFPAYRSVALHAVAGCPRRRVEQAFGAGRFCGSRWSTTRLDRTSPATSS
jgi:hypothetical protein